ncbi:Predicted lactoylglutathione lyase [Luteibacter sp. UNCMF331Sha3.1]|uniref:VOC family protein n=1 Tax=Luteibacter sp. UNCMF331Sha3.1 TaxID=1502760 RepID=UPI0008B9C60E|nr:VOC family protein [Luteibacter sp. UNCMF331Sha3.1]SEN10788.1 Predicted lactoylglutathione lyase [Luteibacter sp. UNCMF331Sha3.1]
MIKHVFFSVANVEASFAFYKPVLAALKAAPLMEVPDGDTGKLAAVGFGDETGPYFWVGKSANAPGYCHVAFSAASREEVRAFFDAAINAGGKDNGAPGPRPKYHPDYYAAFVLDPDGNNIEAAFVGPEG